MHSGTFASVKGKHSEKQGERETLRLRFENILSIQYFLGKVHIYLYIHLFYTSETAVLADSWDAYY